MIEPRTSVVTIYTGDYLDRIRHLEAEAEALDDAIEREKKKSEQDGPRLMADVPEIVALEQRRDAKAAEHSALVQEAESKAIHIKLRALGRKEWKALIEAHPPRENDDSDKQEGVNLDTFPEALVPASIVEPAEFAEDDLDALSDIDFQRLYFAAFALNRVPGGDPKASLVSRLTQTSDETSN